MPALTFVEWCVRQVPPTILRWYITWYSSWVTPGFISRLKKRTSRGPRACSICTFFYQYYWYKAMSFRWQALSIPSFMSEVADANIADRRRKSGVYGKAVCNLLTVFIRHCSVFCQEGLLNTGQASCQWTLKSLQESNESSWGWLLVAEFPYVRAEGRAVYAPALATVHTAASQPERSAHSKCALSY